MTLKENLWIGYLLEKYKYTYNFEWMGRPIIKYQMIW